MNRSEGAQRWIFMLAAGAIAVVLAIVALVLIAGTVGFLRHHSLIGTLIGVHWDPLHGQFQIGPFVLASIVVTLIALLLAVPFGLAAAVFGTMVAGGFERRVLRWVLTVTATVPSVAFGWWGLAVVVPALAHLGLGAGYGILAAAVVLALMIVPTFSLLAMDALAKVPEDFHQASLALGATPDQNLTRMAIPVSASGIKVAILTAVARALGETIAVQMVIGGSGLRLTHLLGSASTLTTTILTDLAVLPVGSGDHGVLDLMALLLFAGVSLLAVWAHAEPGGGL